MYSQPLSPGSCFCEKAPRYKECNNLVSGPARSDRQMSTGMSVELFSGKGASRLDLQNNPVRGWTRNGSGGRRTEAISFGADQKQKQWARKVDIKLPITPSGNTSYNHFISFENSFSFVHPSSLIATKTRVRLPPAIGGFGGCEGPPPGDAGGG
jgi:hypothetical protein